MGNLTKLPLTGWSRPAPEEAPPPPPPPPTFSRRHRPPHEHIFDALEAILNNLAALNAQVDELSTTVAAMQRPDNSRTGT